MFGRKKENLSIFISQKKCTGCEHCVGICAKRVIGMVYNEDKAYATVEYKDRCTICRVCEMLCPVDAIEIRIANKQEKYEKKNA